MTPKRIGRYEIKSEIGRGGMATVYRAHDPSFEREVAVKVLPREFLHDPEFRARFAREAKTIAALEHPAIVPVYDFGEDEGQPYLVMRFMVGGSLADRLEKGPLSPTEAAECLARLGPALDHAHSQGIVHRDLKPGNILFDRWNKPYLSDFGIVKISAASVAYTGDALIGTPAYMSPEQAKGMSDVDGRSDIYALGVILFQMLTGKLPYEADTPMGMAMRHITEPVPHILEVRSDLPAGCEAVITRSLAKDRNDRYPSATAQAAAAAALVSRQAESVEELHATVLEPPPPGEAAVFEPQAPLPPPVFSPATPPPSAMATAPPLERRKRFPAWGWIAGCLLLLGVVVGGAILVGGGGALFVASLATQTPTATQTRTPPTATIAPTLPIFPTLQPTQDDGQIVVGGDAGVTTGTRITVANTGSDAVCYLYISPSTADQWGDDQLGSDTIPPGMGYGFSVAANVSYDLRADDCYDRNVAELFDVTVGQGQEFRWSVAAGQTGVAQVTLVNNGSTDVCYVNISPSADDSWGSDRLATKSAITTGGSVTFHIPTAGTYDFWARDCDRNTLSEIFNEQIDVGDDLEWEVAD